MSLLSAVELLELVETGVIRGVDRESINAASIDLHLGDSFLLETTPNYDNNIIDLSLRQKPIMRPYNYQVDLCPSQFCLASTKEMFYLPDNISAQFMLKSSLARSGLEHSMAGWCLTGETLIPCLDGHVRQIKDIKEGEWVYSLDSYGDFVPGYVEKSFISNHVNTVLDITLDNGKSFSCTDDHLVMLRNGEYCKASMLTTGIAVMPFYDNIAEMTGYNVSSVMRRNFDVAIPVYDLTIEDYHNFALQAGCYVHNCDATWHNSTLTLELTNILKYHTLRLVSGMAIGQIVFFRHTAVPEEFMYRTKGRYNNDLDVTQAKE